MCKLLGQEDQIIKADAVPYSFKIGTQFCWKWYIHSIIIEIIILFSGASTMYFIVGMQMYWDLYPLKFKFVHVGFPQKIKKMCYNK